MRILVKEILVTGIAAFTVLICFRLFELNIKSSIAARNLDNIDISIPSNITGSY